MYMQSINDNRLYGEALISPFRYCLNPFKNIVSSWSDQETLTQRVMNVAKRIPSLVASSIAVGPAGLLASAGVVTKWIDLRCRINTLAQKNSAFTYALPLPLEMYSRLGDRLVAYLDTKFVANQLGLPVYYRPFKGAEYFHFSEIEALKENPSAPIYFKRVVNVTSLKDIQALERTGVKKDDSTLYVLHCAPESNAQVDWAVFKPEVKRLLRVTAPHSKLEIPNGVFSIALHIRTGGDYDRADTSTMLPRKLPPIEYYIGELENLLLNTSKDQPLFVHLFTDDHNPEAVLNKIRNAISADALAGVTFNFTPHPAPLVDDVANMTRFDAMIRPESNLSGTLAKVADHLQVEISPVKFKVNEAWTEIAITQVKAVKSVGPDELRDTDYRMPVVKRLPELYYRMFHRIFS